MENRDNGTAELLARLRRSESQLAEAQSQTHIGSWDWEVATDTVTWSNELYRIFGLDPQSFGATFQAYLDRVHPDDRARVEAAVRRTLETGTPMHHTGRIVRPDGTHVVLDTRARRITDEQGNAMSLVGTCRDVTRDHQLREQVLRMQRMDAVGQLAGGIAHDFNNLLTVILSYCELMKRAPDSVERVLEGVEQIREAANSAAGMTRQLLTFARGGLGPKEVIDLGDAMRSAEKMLSRLIDENIALEVTAAANLARVRCSRTQLEQILVNLAVNARDAMPGGGSLTIDARNERVDESQGRLAPGNYVVLSVADTGVGMTPAVIARAFEPFFSTKPPGKGVGLGLSTIYGIVTSCGGDVLIDSEPGRGTTISIWHPTTTDPVDASGIAPKPNPARGGRVLVVEDSPSLGTLIARIVREAGYDVDVVTDGEMALAHFDKGAPAPDMMITDVVLPGMSGVELAASARVRYPSLPVIYMSGYPNRAEAVASSGLGDGGHFLSKPFTPDQLLAAIETALAPR